MKHQPLRMCIVCRTRKEKDDLLKLVKTKNNEIEMDFSGKKEGRGVYICYSEDCIQKLKKQKSLNRAFSMNVPDEIYENVIKTIKEKVEKI